MCETGISKFCHKHESFHFYPIRYEPHLYQIWHLYHHLCDCTKRLVLPVLLCVSDASLIIADNCNALGLIPPPAGRSVSACLISYVNYGDTSCKVSNLSLFVTQFRSRVGRFESSTGILSISVILVSKS